MLNIRNSWFDALDPADETEMGTVPDPGYFVLYLIRILGTIESNY